MKQKVNINGKCRELEINAGQTLLEALRANNYTEVKCGCNEGECGACLVLLDGKPVNSCQVLVMSVRRKKITTIKGIGSLYSPNVLQKAFVEAGADQCGFCSPGMIIASYALLKKNPTPSEEEIAEAIDGNLCRCTGYVKIIEAVRNTADKLKTNNKPE